METKMNCKQLVKSWKSRAKNIGLSQPLLAEKAGISVGTLNVAMGKGGNPTADTIDKVEAALRSAEEEALKSLQERMSLSGNDAVTPA